MDETISVSLAFLARVFTMPRATLATWISRGVLPVPRDLGGHVRLTPRDLVGINLLVSASRVGEGRGEALRHLWNAIQEGWRNLDMGNQGFASVVHGRRHVGKPLLSLWFGVGRQDGFIRILVVRPGCAPPAGPTEWLNLSAAEEGYEAALRGGGEAVEILDRLEKVKNSLPGRMPALN